MGIPFILLAAGKASSRNWDGLGGPLVAGGGSFDGLMLRAHPKSIARRWRSGFHAGDGATDRSSVAAEGGSGDPTLRRRGFA